MMQKIEEETIDRVIDGWATAEESDLVTRWFATPEGQAYLSKRIDKEFYTDTDLTTLLMEEHDIPSDDIYSRIVRRLFVKRIIKISTYAAAIILPLLLCVWGLKTLDSRVDLFGKTEYVNIYVPKGERMQVIFPDGSLAHLNSDTKLSYPKKFGFSDRKIQMDGEAYFQIEKNQNRPFVVELDSVAINVTGTSFNLEAYSSERTISVVLDEGKVNLKPHKFSKKYDLEPGEKMVYDKYNGSCIIMANNATVSPSQWKDDMLYLKNKPLQEVINVLDRKYDKRFKIVDKEALKYSYTILISKNTSFEKVLLDLQKIAPVIFTLENDTVNVKIKEK